MTAKKPSSCSEWVDPDDAPEITAQMIEAADVYEGTKLVSRGRPKLATPKQAIKVRLDADVLEALRASGDGWQTRINDTLRASLRLAGRI
jgi:uncharacterized protein (DUF4415 family)